MTIPPDSPTGSPPNFLPPGTSPPTALEQLETALRTGAITPELFATLRAQLVLSPIPTGYETASPAADFAEAASIEELPPVAQAPSATMPAAPSVATELPSLLSLFEDAPKNPAATAIPAAPPLPAPPLAASPQATAPPEFLPPARLDRPAASAPPAAPPAPVPVAHAAPPEFLPPPAAPRPAPTPMPEMASSRPVPVLPRARPAGPVAAPVPRPGNRLTIALVAMGLLCLLAVGAYLLVDQSHPSENLTGSEPLVEAGSEKASDKPLAAGASRPQPPAEQAPISLSEPDNEVALPILPPDNSADQPMPEPAATAGPTASSPTAPAIPPVAPDAAANAEAGATLDAPAPVPAAPEAGDDAATRAVRTVLASYYADLFAPPLKAENYFAPQVERLYVQRDLTPAKINATISQTFFPDNQQAVYQIEPGTLKVSPPVKDGSRVATYTESARVFRVSLGRYQRLRTQVRVRFDKEGRITFMRQEKLLQNTFE